jgi:hypothetical protein
MSSAIFFKNTSMPDENTKVKTIDVEYFNTSSDPLFGRLKALFEMAYEDESSISLFDGAEDQLDQLWLSADDCDMTDKGRIPIWSITSYNMKDRHNIHRFFEVSELTHDKDGCHIWDVSPKGRTQAEKIESLIFYTVAENLRLKAGTVIIHKPTDPTKYFELK